MFVKPLCFSYFFLSQILVYLLNHCSYSIFRGAAVGFTASLPLNNINFMINIWNVFDGFQWCAKFPIGVNFDKFLCSTDVLKKWGVPLDQRIGNERSVEKQKLSDFRFNWPLRGWETNAWLAGKAVAHYALVFPLKCSVSRQKVAKMLRWCLYVGIFKFSKFYVSTKLTVQSAY